MGFSDADFEKAKKAGVSDTQLYKQAGNSIVVDVLYYIYKALYKEMPHLLEGARLTSLFSGIGAFEKALNRVALDYGFGWSLGNYCEIDKYASKSYSAVFGVNEKANLGDINAVNTKDIVDFDILVGGSPCQDFSVAGKQKGAQWTCSDCGYVYNPLEARYDKRDRCPRCSSDSIEKTRSSLIAEYLRVLREKKPRLALYENVKNIVGKQFKATFDMFVKELEEYGYNVYYKVLNAKDYGVPQNRERLYLVAIRKDEDKGTFEFPEGFDNGVRLCDIMDCEVDEKYYIKTEAAEKVIAEVGSRVCIGESEHKPVLVGGIGEKNYGKQYRQGNRIYDAKNVAMCLLADSVGNAGGYSYLYLVEGTNKPLKVGNLYTSGGQNGVVYDSKGISPAIVSGVTNVKGNGGVGSSNAPKVLCGE